MLGLAFRRPWGGQQQLDFSCCLWRMLTPQLRPQRQEHPCNGPENPCYWDRHSYGGPDDGDWHREPEESLYGDGSPSGRCRKAVPKRINLPFRLHVVSQCPNRGIMASHAGLSMPNIRGWSPWSRSWSSRASSICASLQEYVGAIVAFRRQLPAQVPGGSIHKSKFGSARIGAWPFSGPRLHFYFPSFFHGVQCLQFQVARVIFSRVRLNEPGHIFYSSSALRAKLLMKRLLQGTEVEEFRSESKLAVLSTMKSVVSKRGHFPDWLFHLVAAF